MSKGLINFKGLYGDNNQSVAELIHHEKLEERSKIYDWEINEHIHTDLIQVFIFTSGEGLLFSEQKKIPLISPSILIIPSNTLHGFVFQEGISGDVLTFSETYFEGILKNSPLTLLALNRLKNYTFESKIDNFNELMTINRNISLEISNDKAEKAMFLQSLFQLFFLNIFRVGLQENNQITKSDNRTLNYFQSFQKSIKLSIHETKSINDYASELNITTVHLNRICQSLVKKSALQIVHEYLINEAKKYLKNTSHSIAEISYFLDFKDPAYFTRLFKKTTGLSPSEYRKK
jgi:AraC family transcriptional regulator, transcriptional activator of pobA